MSNTTSTPMNRRRLLHRAAQAAGLGIGMATLPLARVFAEDKATGTKKAASFFKYAICSDAFCDWPLEKGFALAAECGYQGIEIAPYNVADNVTEISAARRREIRRQAESHHLEILGLHALLVKTTKFFWTSPDADVRRQTSAYFGELARFCSDLGGKLMVLGAPAKRNLAAGVSKEQGMQNAADIITGALPVLEKTGVAIALEPLGPSETNFMNSAAEGAELMRKVNSPYCRLHLDCKAMSEEATPIPDIIRKFQADFIHFHANDPNRLGPGFGKLDFTPILKTLKEIDYRGWVSVEPVEYGPGPERLTRESIAYLRRCEPQE